MEADSDKLVALAVDLDGTLIRSDLFAESLLALLRKNPFYLFVAVWWLLSGRARLKQQVARRVQIDPASLPYRDSVLDFVREQFATGRPTILATGSDQVLAAAVADHLGCFTEVMASDGETNRTGRNKRTMLIARFGEGGYDYIGNSSADFPAWEAAAEVMVATRGQHFARRVAGKHALARQFSDARVDLATWLRALRVHQWLKNLLIFVPLLVGHAYGDSALVIDAAIGFVAFCACASAVYLINDLMDLPHDRQHPRKRKRPLASGDLPIIAAMLVAPMLLVSSLLLSQQLPGKFLEAIGLYFAVTLAYSLGLKRYAMVDVLILAGLYTLRIIAGGAAVAIPLSFWLLAFSMFLFLSLALMKRFTELREMEQGGSVGAGRGYRDGDSDLLAALGGGSAYSAVLVLALYINSEAVTQYYSNLRYMWLICPVMLYWISHMWFSAHRGRMRDDPIVFALRDWTSLSCAGALLLLFVLAH
ncbi:MAG: UbiA family prenyltransferase [Halieaceae bacterium]